MLDSHVLDVLIGIVFIYLILSLICSAIMEMIAMMQSLRAKTRKEWIERVLGKNLAEELYKNSLIYSLGNKGNKIGNWIERIKQRIKKEKKEIYGFPSYIPANAFVLALISTICKECCKLPTNDRSRCNSRKFMFCLLEGKLDGNCKDEGLSRTLDILKIFASEADRDVSKFIQSIEEWFNDAMDRVSGWYKRKTQTGIFFIALAIALILNLDTIQIVQAIYKDSVLSEALVSSAKNFVAINISQNDSFETLTAVLNQTNESVARLNFYIGWKCWNSSLGIIENLKKSACIIINSLITNPLKIVGILATALSAVFGAPFWFDLLGRFVRLRSTGEKPKKRKSS